MKLSVVISAYNEEKKIKDCLESVKWADEIIVVNNSSTDSTAAIAKKYTPHIYSQPNNLMLNVNKNFGFSKTTHEWILSLDADERITPDLKEEIISQLSPFNSLPVDLSAKASASAEASAKAGQLSGFWIPRKNIIFGKWIEHTGWYPDYQLRLFRKSHGRFEEKHIHEMVKLKGEAGYLKNPFIHYNYETITQFLHKTIVIYAPNEAANKLQDGYVFNYIDAIRLPWNEFLKRFFADKGYKDGFHGLMLSILMAFYHFIVFAYIWERNKFIDEKVKSRELLEDGLKKARKEIKFWLVKQKIEEEKNSLIKFSLKIKNKLHL